MDFTDERGTWAALQCVIEEQEIRMTTYRFPDGPVEGYEWRLRVSFPATATSPSRTEWLPWVFGSNRSVEGMLAQWQRFATTHGHLSRSAPPDTSLQ
jgi:hypothetical protein